MKNGLFLTVCFIAFTYNIVAQNENNIGSIQYQNGQVETFESEKTKLNMYTNDEWKSKKGGTLIGLGSLMTVGGIFALVVAADEAKKDMSVFGYSLLGAGLACIATGIPIRIIGKNKENQELRNINVLNEMKSNYPAMYSQYRSGQRMRTTGWILLSAGATVFAFDVYWLREEAFDLPTVTLGVFLMVGSIGCIVTSIPFHIIGGNKKNHAIKEFTRQNYSSHTWSHFQLNVYPNRVGIAYVF